MGLQLMKFINTLKNILKKWLILQISHSHRRSENGSEIAKKRGVQNRFLLGPKPPSLPPILGPILGTTPPFLPEDVNSGYSTCYCGFRWTPRGVRGTRWSVPGLPGRLQGLCHRTARRGIGSESADLTPQGAFSELKQNLTRPVIPRGWRIVRALEL